MRKRSVGINVRVSVTEKRKMTLMAKRCGLSLSEYLRQRALGYEPGGHPPTEVFNVLDKLDEIAESCQPSAGAKITACADEIRDLLIAVTKIGQSRTAYSASLIMPPTRTRPNTMPLLRLSTMRRTMPRPS